MSSRSVITSTLRNQNLNARFSKTGNIIRNPQLTPSHPSRMLSPHLRHNPGINIINNSSTSSASLRTTRPVNYNRNKSSYSKSTNTPRNFSTTSLDSSSSSASYNSNNSDTLSQFSNGSGVSSITSFQSSVAPSPSRNLVDFDILKLLGTGGTGRVYLARDKRTDNLVALKVISKTGRSDIQLKDILNEQKIHRLVSDPVDEFILPILGSGHDELNFFIITPYIPGSDLAVESMKSRRVGEDKVRFYAAELVAALDSLHKKNVIHRDVKPGNILLDADGHIRLCDYGSAIAFAEPTGWREKQEPIPAFITFDVDGSCNSGAFLKPSMEPVFMTNDICGTPYFMSPEQHKGKHYSFDADFWALGVSIFRMLTGRMPFGDHVLNKDDIKDCVVREPLVFRPSDDISPVTRALLEGLLAKRPRDRLSLTEIKAHPYFQDVNWEEVAKRGLPCTSKPYLSPVPKHPKAISPTLPGALYTNREDPYPLFHYTSEELDKPFQCSLPSSSPTPIEECIEQESKSNIFKRAGKIFKSLFRKSDKLPPSNLRPNSQAFRPLLLPSIVSNERSPSPPPSVHPAEGSYIVRSSRFSDTELVPPLPRRQLPAFAGSGFLSPPSHPLARAGSYVPRKASPLQKSHSLPPLPPPPQTKACRPCSAEKEKTDSLPSLLTCTDPSPRSSALGRFKGWATRLSCVSEDSRADNGPKKEKRKIPVGGSADDDDGDDDGWDFRCRGDPDEQLMQCTVSEKR